MDNTDTGREQKQVRPENETRAQRMEQASRNEYMDETAEKNSEQTENNPAVAPIENASGSNSQNETNVQNKAFSGSKHDAGHTQPGGAASFGQQVNNGQQAAGNNAVPGAGQVQVSGNGIKTAGSRTSGRQMDGQFLRSQQMGQASAKNVENTGQKGSSALDFHNLLEGAGKARTRNLQTKMQSGHQPSGQNSTGQTVKLNEPGSIRELANVVRSRIGSNNSSMLLRLDPPELGKLRIDVQMRNGQFTVRLEAQTQAGHDALQSRLTDLRHTLEQQGIQLNQVEVELKPPAPVNESSNARMHDQNAGQQSGAFENENNGAGQSSGDPNHFSSGHPQSDVPTEQEQVPEHAATTAEEPPQPIAGPANKGVDLVI
jgi:flagellar hook-length control protein FliK